jgi:two-component sensor histidine kinase
MPDTSTSATLAMNFTCVAAKTLAGEVRQRVHLRLHSWSLAHLADNLLLIATELVTNACTATPDQNISVRFTREPHSVCFAVWDSSNLMPQIRSRKALTLQSLDLSPTNFDANGGWGLPLVESLSTECGISPTTPFGKWVWARSAT